MNFIVHALRELYTNIWLWDWRVLAFCFVWPWPLYCQDKWCQNTAQQEAKGIKSPFKCGGLSDAFFLLFATYTRAPWIIGVTVEPGSITHLFLQEKVVLKGKCYMSLMTGELSQGWSLRTGSAAVVHWVFHCGTGMICVCWQWKGYDARIGLEVNVMIPNSIFDWQ